MIRAKKSVQWICIKDKIIKEWKKQNADKKRKSRSRTSSLLKKIEFERMLFRDRGKGLENALDEELRQQGS